MAQINQISASNGALNELLGSWLATICVMAAMIISLVGIKIWWFKHRLNFEHNSTHNGAAGGSQPIIGTSIKYNKRDSQEVCDSVVVHGVFRKREENELEIIERPRQLPPIRIPERSQSTPTLVLPPRTKRSKTAPNVPLILSTPPTREPPSPGPQYASIKPTISLGTLPPSTPPLAEDAIQPNLENYEFKKMENSMLPRTLEKSSTASVVEIIMEEPQKQKEQNELVRHFQKSRIPSDQRTFEKMGNERRATGFLRPDDISIDFTDSSTANNHQYDTELLTPGMDDCFENMEVQAHIERVPNKFPDKFHFENKEDKEDEEVEESNWKEVKLHQAEIIEESDYYVEKEDPWFAKVKRQQRHHVEFQLLDDDEDTKAEEILNLENKDLLHRTKDLWEEEEEEQIQYPSDFHKEFSEHDFFPQSLSEPDFDKIRHNFHEHEGHFLEDEVEVLKPKGFGKSIDEDWENFQDLKISINEKENEIREKPINIETSREITTKTISLRREEQETLETFEEILNSTKSGNEENFIEIIEELYKELTVKDLEMSPTNLNEDFDEPSMFPASPPTTASPPQKASILKGRMQDFANAGYETPTAKARKLKSAQKVTFDFNTEEYYLPESESESEPEEITPKINKKKNRRNDYYIDYDEDDDEDEDDDDHDDDVYQGSSKPPSIPAPIAIPTPMQRTTTTTKNHNENNNNNNNNNNNSYQPHHDDEDNQSSILNSTTFQSKHSSHKHHEEIHRKEETSAGTAALLFSTQISLDDSETSTSFNTENDSWSAIRQRRLRKEEFHQIELSDSQAIQESPRPAHRKFVPQPQKESGGLGQQQVLIPAPRSNRNYQRQMSFEDNDKTFTDA